MSTHAEELARKVTIVKPQEGRLRVDFRELWEYRELLFFLVWRDIKVRYKQTVIGGAWAILQPTASMVIFSIFFGRFANIPSDGVPYPLFAYAGLLPWLYFSSSMSQCGISVVGNAALITKVYFPRLIIPLNGVFVPIVDFFLASSVLGALYLYYHETPAIQVVFLPVFLLLALMTALGAGLWLSALTVRYRDIPYALPFLVQLWFFASPVVYPVSLIPERWQWVYSLNPMVGVLDGFRWCLLDRPAPGLEVVGVSALVGITLIVTGLFYFKRVERHFADII